MTQQTSEKSRGIVKNALFGFSTWLLPLALSFAATPVVVRSLGHEDYGIYALVLGFIAYSFNFNVGRAVTKYLAEYRLGDDAGKIPRIISATFFLNLAVGLAGLAIICMAAGWLVSDVFMIEPAARDKTVRALYLSALIIFFTMLNQVFSSVLQGIHRFDVYSKIFNFNNISLILGNLLLALGGYQLIALLGWNLLVTIVSGLIYYRAAVRLTPEFRIGLDFGRENLKLVLNFSWGVVGYQILANIFLLFERSWIIRRLGAEDLTFYIVPMMLALYLHSFVASITLVVFPLASELHGDRDKLLRLYTKATKIVCTLVVFAVVTLIVESGTFLTLWMGAEFSEKSSGPLVLHTLTFGIAAVYIIAFQMAEGLGYPSFNFLMMGVGLLVGIPLMIVLTVAYGNDGAAAARLAAFGTIFLSTFYLENKFFGRVQVGFWVKTLGFLGAAALLAAFVERTVVVNTPLNWFSFLLAAACGGIVYGGALWLSGFVTAEERELFRRIAGR